MSTSYFKQNLLGKSSFYFLIYLDLLNLLVSFGGRNVDALADRLDELKPQRLGDISEIILIHNHIPIVTGGVVIRGG